MFLLDWVVRAHQCVRIHTVQHTWECCRLIVGNREYCGVGVKGTRGVAMYTEASKFGLVGAILVGLIGANPVQAGNGRVVQFDIRVSPGDTGSDVNYSVLLDLNKQDTMNQYVGWEVLRIEFQKLDENGDVVTAWVEDFPVIDSPDGLWWTIHGNPGHPVRGEFVQMPLLLGTAVSCDSSMPLLQYDISSEEYVPPVGQVKPFEATAALTYYLAIGDDPEGDPDSDGDDDPVDMPDPIREPYCN